MIFLEPLMEVCEQGLLLDGDGAGVGRGQGHGLQLGSVSQAHLNLRQPVRERSWVQSNNWNWMLKTLFMWWHNVKRKCTSFVLNLVKNIFLTYQNLLSAFSFESKLPPGAGSTYTPLNTFLVVRCIRLIDIFHERYLET